MSTPLAELLHVLDTLTSRARIERWCVLDMVPPRWEPLTGWLGERAWSARLAALPPYGLYRVVDQRTRHAEELIPTPTGQFLHRTDGRSWVDPPEWKWEPQPAPLVPQFALTREYGLGVYRRGWVL